MVKGRCERCGGNLYVRRDEEGDVWLTCLQCARSVPLRVSAPLPRVRCARTYDSERAYADLEAWLGREPA